MGFRILESFDYYNTSALNTGIQVNWSNQSGGGGYNTVAGRFGGQGCRMTDAVGATSNMRRLNYGAAHSDFSVGFAWRYNSGGSAFGNAPIARLEYANSAQLSIYADGNAGGGVIFRVYRGLGATLLCTSAPGLLTQATWGYIQIFGKIHQTLGWVELWINGVFQQRFDGDTAAAAGVEMDGFLVGCIDHSGSGNAQDFDDMYVADDFQNYGQCTFEVPRPSADTADKDFTRSTGADNYALVDEAIVATADYVESGVLNDYDLYELSNLSSNPAIIHAVKPVYVASKTDVGDRRVAMVLSSNGTLDTSASQVITNDPVIYQGQTLLLNPDGNIAWTKAAVDALKLGPKVAL